MLLHKLGDLNRQFAFFCVNLSRPEVLTTDREVVDRE